MPCSLMHVQFQVALDVYEEVSVWQVNIAWTVTTFVLLSDSNLLETLGSTLPTTLEGTEGPPLFPMLHPFCSF